MISVFHKDVPGKSTARSLLDTTDAGGEAIRDGLASFYKKYSQNRSEILAPDFAASARIVEAMAKAPAEPENEVVGLIVETRKHPNLEIVVQEACEMLDVPVRLICGASNHDFILKSRIGRLIEEGKVRLDVLPDLRFDRHVYNGLFLTPAFWALFEKIDKVLVFQTDCVFCRNSDYTLKDFMHFDYIGSMWRAERTAQISFAGGNGGLSLRDPRAAIRCLETFSPAQWPASEDKYFAFHLELIGARVASHRESSRFGSERWFLHRSFGAHNVAVMYATHLADFLEYCPSGARIMGQKKPNLSLRKRMRMRANKLLLRAYLRLR
ncbi:DUF5672 family protein [Limimaricola litoreus]|uniref:DUF5672 domain-containing protein n=1 Tax=Limimaricola litoreus TaxID=2955316 RepID=A0A9X2JR64_9RHOB|nr:DUF5672 family protein [Limimaricola litoreus]MCP1168376.1 hypothetical protein [Limimaricola litoreus]